MEAAPQVRGGFDEPVPGSSVTGRRVRIAGWVFDEGGPLDRVLAVVGDLPPVTLTVGAWRADIAATFAHIPHAGASGFKCDVDLRSTPSGSISVALLARRRTGQWQPVTEYNVTVIAPVEDRGPRRAAAAFTIAQNEPLMLPLWVDYYRRYFDADDLYVLDHDSADESVRRVADRCHVVPVHRAMSFDHRWLRGTVESFQSFLLSSYETVLFAEVDEFVIADPRRYGGLGDYIARLRHLAVRCAGFNVVHQPDEPPIRFDEPILAQRAYWHASLGYSKRLIARVPLAWSEGFHEEYNAPDHPPDPALMLVHLHRVDYDRCLARHRSSASRNWSVEDIARGDGQQNRIAGDEEFSRWFHHGPDLDAPRELIPEHVRAVL